MTSYQLLFHFTKKKDEESHDTGLQGRSKYVFVSVYGQKNAFFTLSCS